MLKVRFLQTPAFASLRRIAPSVCYAGLCQKGVLRPTGAVIFAASACFRPVPPVRGTPWCGGWRFRYCSGLFQELEDLFDGEGGDPEGEMEEDLVKIIHEPGRGKRACLSMPFLAESLC